MLNERKIFTIHNISLLNERKIFTIHNIPKNYFKKIIFPPDSISGSLDNILLLSEAF